MKSNKSYSTTTFQNGKQSKGKSTNAAMQPSQLMYFNDELKDLYLAAIPKIQNANNSK